MSNPFDQFDAPAAEGGNPFDQFDAPAAKKLPSKGILSDVGGAFVEGAKSAGRAIAGTANIYAGDESALVEKAQAQESAQAQKPAALTAFNQAVTERVKPLGDDPGLLDSVKAIGGAVVDQPKGAGLAVVEQLPNAAPAIAGGMAGMKAGAALGTAIMPGVGTTIGAIGGGLAGMFLGNTAIETGYKGIEAAQDGAVTQDEMSRVKKEGAVKAGVITGVDALTLGLSKAVTNIPARAVESATRNALTKAGVNVADEAAVLAARQSPEISAAVRAAQESAFASANTLGKRAAAGGAALGLETVGEGLGEYLGELAATGKANVADAVLEAMMSLGQSGAEVAWGAARNKKAEQGGMWDTAEAKFQPPPPTLVTEPEPLQQRIDALMGIDTGAMSDKERTQYEKDLTAAFLEPVGVTQDEHGLEIPFTMADYLNAQVRAEDSVRARPLKQNAADQSGNRLQQLADEETQQQPDIPGYVAPEIPVVGTLSAMANMAIQSGAHKQSQMQQAMQAAVEKQKSTSEGSSRAAQPEQMAAQAPQANDAQAPAFDVSTRTEGQLSYLAQNGQPGWKEAATAEIQRRGVQISQAQQSNTDAIAPSAMVNPDAPAANSASVPALKASDSAKAPEIQNGDGVTNLPTEKLGIKTIDRWSAEELQGRLDRGNLSPESEQRLRAELAKRQPVKQSAPQASPLTVGKTPNGAEPVTVRNGVVHVGDYPAIDYETEADITVPEGATPQQIADALRNGGALGSRKIFGLKADEQKPQEKPAVEDTIGWTRMTTVEREALVAKAGWTGKTRGINLGGAIVAKQAWGKMSEANRAKLVAASQIAVKKENPSAATVAEETAAPDQAPIKKDEQPKNASDRLRSGEINVEQFMEATGLTDDDVGTFSSNGARNKADAQAKKESRYHAGIEKISAAIFEAERGLTQGSTAQSRRAYQANVAKYRQAQETLGVIAKHYEHPFKNTLLSKLPPFLESRFGKQWDGIEHGDSAKRAFHGDSYRKWVDLLIGAADNKNGTPISPAVSQPKTDTAPEAKQDNAPVSTLQPDPALQNRDRGRAASVNQMQSIARNPDYMRLGPSRTPDSGAPMVFAVGGDTNKIAPSSFGANDIAVMSDGQRVPFRYAVVDASSVEPSNFADGATNPAFASNAPGTIKALNNGRTAGVRAAHEGNTAANYTAELLADQAHGVSPAAIRNTPNPMLVRVYAEQANTGDMAAKSQGQGLGMSASERAAQDAEQMTGDVLDKFAPGDIASAGNRDFVRAFVGKLAENELADMMDATGNLSQDGRRRIEAALLTAAYGKSDLVQELFESTDTDIKAIGNALKVLSGQWASMRNAAKDGTIDPDTDMTANLMEAVNIVRRSRAEGSSIAELAGQGDLMGGNYLNELSELFLRIFYKGKNYDRARGGDKVIAALHDVVTSAMNTKAEAGLFGDSFKATPKQIVESARSKIDEENKPASQAALFGANGQVAAVSQGNRSEGTAQPGQVGSRPVGTDRSQEAGKQAEPVAKAAEQSPAVDAKEPWQMTRKEWYDAKNNDRAETFGSSGKRNGAAETAARIERKARLNYGVAENGEPVDHRQVIEKAIADGKQIPDEVLADYPDLKESGIALLSPSLGRVDANKVDIAVASKVVADLLSGWRNAPDSRVVATFDDLPAAVRKEIEDQGEKTARGVFHGDTFYLIADEHASANEIEETIFHEVWAHYGLRSMLGANTTRELAGVFDQISASGIMGVNGKDAFRAFARRNGFNTAQTESMLRKAEAFDPRFTEAMKKRILVEELIAKVQEKGDNPSLKRKAQEIIGAIREWLRKVGFSGLMKYSDADLMRLVQKARDTVKYGKRGSSGKGDVPSVLMTAWHGSPHDHDKFDSSKIGTGEGAQAYGYGHYFAGAKDVAEWYRRKLSGADNSSITFNGKQYGDSDAANRKLTNDVKKWAEETGRDPERIDVALEYLAGMAGDLGSARQLAAKEGLGISHWIYGTLNDLSEHLYPSPNGRLYQVELAPTADEYLDWDKPLSEQSEFVRNALTDKSHFIGEYLSDTLEIAKNNGVDFNERGDTLYKIVSDQYGSDKAASDYLHSIGIRGIRYLDGSSRSAGEGNSNYVIFNDADVSITAKYNKASKDKLTPADKAIYGMAAEGKSAAEVLKFIASASRSPFNRQVAKLLMKTGIAPSVTVGDGKGWKMNAGEGNKYAAGYNPKSDTISLFRPASAERHVLHELMHAATLKALNQKGLAAIQMKALFAHVKKTGELNGMYGMSDVDEFVAEAFTNPKFQAALKKVSAPATSNLKSGWHWFVRIVRNILGLPQGQENALSQAIEIGLGVMRENMALNDNARPRQEALMEMPAVSVRFRIDGDFETVKARARADYGMLQKASQESGQGAVTTDGKTVKFSSSGFKKASQHGADRRVLAVIANAKKLIESAMPLYSAEPGKAEQGVRRYHYYGVKANFGLGGDALVLLSIKESTNGEWFYDADATGVEIARAVYSAALAGRTKTGAGDTESTAPKGRLASWLAGVNQGERVRYNVADEGWSVAEPSKMDDVIYALQDKQIDMKRVVQSIMKTGKQIKDDFNAYLQEELFHGRAANGVKDFLDFELRPLLAEMQKAGIDMGDFEEYLWNRHAPERNAQIAKINPDMPDGGSGIETAKARAYLAGLSAEQRKTFEALAAKVEAMNRESQRVLIESGLEKQSTIDAWNGAYQHYVPLQREDVDSGHVGTGKGFSVRGSSTKRAMGSGRQVVDIIANLTMQRERNIVRAEKNRVSNALLGLAVQNPNPEFWKVDQAPKERVVEETAIYTVRDEAGKKLEEFTRMDEADRFARQHPGSDIEQTWGDRVKERVTPGFTSRDNVLLTRINGEDHYVIFNERDERAVRMAMSMKNLDVDNMGRVLSVVGKATRYLASVNTQYNPVFGVINLIRDAQGALINLTSTPLAGEQKRVLGYTVDALRGIYADIRAHRKGEKPSSKWAALFEEFQKEGGQTGYRDQYANSEARAEAIKSELEQFKEGKAKQFTRGIFGWLSDYNETMENAVRLAAYKAAKEKGMSNQQAASLAKNITVNFNRKGQMATQVGALYAFFNASVQGTARIAETLFEQRGGELKNVRLSKVGKKIVAGGIMLGSMQAMLLAAAGFDDDEPPEFIRERNLILPIGDGKYLTMAMPLGFHVIPGIGRIATEFVLSGGKDPIKRMASFASMFAESFNPIGSSGFSLQTITPSVVDPFAALAENKDFTGKEIYREDFNKLNPTPGHARAKDVATFYSRWISEALNFITGGTEFKPGLISWSPDSIDYLVAQAGGGVMREANKVFQTAGAAYSGEDLPLYKIPLAGRFIGDTEGQSGQSAKFYEAIKQINMHEAEYKGLLKDGRRQEAAAYLVENPAVKLILAGNHVESQVRKLRSMKRDLVEKEASQDQVRAIDERITATMRKFNDRVSPSI